MILGNVVVSYFDLTVFMSFDSMAVAGTVSTSILPMQYCDVCVLMALLCHLLVLACVT